MPQLCFPSPLPLVKTFPFSLSKLCKCFNCFYSHYLYARVLVGFTYWLISQDFMWFFSLILLTVLPVQYRKDISTSLTTIRGTTEFSKVVGFLWLNRTMNHSSITYIILHECLYQNITSLANIFYYSLLLNTIVIVKSIYLFLQFPWTNIWGYIK